MLSAINIREAAERRTPVSLHIPPPYSMITPCRLAAPCFRHRTSSQFSPLNAFGCNLRSNFPATLFRFPLRTPEQASVSRLSRQAHGVTDIRVLLQAFARESAGMLLFLKNVERMSVFEWAPGQSEPKQVSR